MSHGWAYWCLRSAQPCRPTADQTRRQTSLRIAALKGPSTATSLDVHASRRPGDRPGRTTGVIAAGLRIPAVAQTRRTSRKRIRSVLISWWIGRNAVWSGHRRRRPWLQGHIGCPTSRSADSRPIWEWWPGLVADVPGLAERSRRDCVNDQRPLGDFSHRCRLPDSHTPFPQDLWNIRFGARYDHHFDNGWTGGVNFGVGTSGDKPFDGIGGDGCQLDGLSPPAARRTQRLLLSLNYSTNSQVLYGIPIPGVAYFWAPSDAFRQRSDFPSPR